MTAGNEVVGQGVFRLRIKDGQSQAAAGSLLTGSSTTHLRLKHNILAKFTCLLGIQKITFCFIWFV